MQNFLYQRRQSTPHPLHKVHNVPEDGDNGRYDVYLTWINGHDREFCYRKLVYGEEYIIPNNHLLHKIVYLWSGLPHFVRPFYLYYQSLPKAILLCPYLSCPYFQR